MCVETKRSFVSRSIGMLMSLLLFLMKIPLTAQVSVEDSCWPDVTILKNNIKKLENKVLIQTWRVEHLRMHKYFKPTKDAVSGSKPHTDPVPHANPYDSLNATLPGTGSLIVHDRDCSELFDRLRPQSGFYRIRPEGHQEPFLVFCDMEDGGGWTVFQRRRHGKVNFNRDWVDYRDGFGDYKLRNDEFWLGNNLMYSLLSEGRNLVKIDLMDWSGQQSHAFYENVRITDEADKYRLQHGQYSGKAGDALSGMRGVVDQWSSCHSGMQFSTKDQDNDRFLQGNCAQENQGGWWFNRCHAANLNGKYYRKGVYKSQHDNGVVWGTWKGLWYSLRHTTIKVRPLLFMDSFGSGAGET